MTLQRPSPEPRDSIIDLLGAPPDVADIELETPKLDDVAQAADLD